MNLRDILLAKAMMGKGGGSTVGVSSWKDLTDKPTETIGGDTLTWNGNTEGLTHIEAINVYKISEAIVTAEDVSNGYYLTSSGEGSSGTAVLSCIEMANGVLMTNVDGYFFIFVSEEGAGVDVDGITFPEPGVYSSVFIVEGEVATLTFNIPGYTGFAKEVLKKEVLPGAVIFYASETDEYLYNTADVSNTENRTTRAELLEAMRSGMRVYVDLGGVMYFGVSNIVDMESFALCDAFITSVEAPTVIQAVFLYTAEYTSPETTAE